MNEMDEMNRRLRDLLEAAPGEPPHLVSVQAVRRRATRRRVRDAVGVLAAVTVLAMVGVTAAAGVFRAAPGPAGQKSAATTAYVAYDPGWVKPGKFTPGAIIPISTATNAAGTPIRLRNLSGDIQITPDGKTLYAAAAHKVIPISTATNTPGKPIPVPIRVGLPGGVVTP